MQVQRIGERLLRKTRPGMKRAQVQQSIWLASQIWLWVNSFCNFRSLLEQCVALLDLIHFSCIFSSLSFYHSHPQAISSINPWQWYTKTLMPIYLGLVLTMLFHSVKQIFSSYRHEHEVICTNLTDLLFSTIPFKTLVSKTGTALLMQSVKPCSCPEFQMVLTAFYLLLKNGIFRASYTYIKFHWQIIWHSDNWLN